MKHESEVQAVTLTINQYTTVMAMVGVDDSSYRQTHSPSVLTWSEDQQYIYQMNRVNSCSDNINIVVYY